jgi:hypothetical protein
VAQMRPLPAAQLTHLLAEEAESALAP